MLADRPIKVLLIEDNPGDARLIRLYAEENGDQYIQLRIADRLQQGIEQLRAEPPDIVLLDLNLSDSEGLETLFALTDAEFSVPIIVVSGMIDQELALKAVRMGAQDYLIKGAGLDQILMRSIRHALERHRLYMVQHELSLRDDLTRLYNRRGLNLLAEQQLRLSKRRAEPVSVLVADVDQMKLINDQFGHAAGDMALKDVARVMRLAFRSSDVLARVGGDEFVVFAIDTQPEDELRLITRWQEELSSYLTSTNRQYPLTLSIGVVTSLPSEGETIDALIARADQRMYRMKLTYRQPAKEEG
ncbi:MAG: diguanylate cyclase [Anaerolineales bacterium]